MFYDKKGAMMAAGAETSLDENIELFETEEWTKVEWYVQICSGDLWHFLTLILPLGSSFVCDRKACPLN